MSENRFKPGGRKQDIAIQEFNDEILIYDLKSNRVFNLNETSALVWQLADGNKNVSDIAENLSEKFRATVAEDFVWLAIEQLEKENLLENVPETSPGFGGLSRREVIRKLGLATMVALPVVASLAAPTAAHAQSGCGANSGRPNGCACTQQGQCSSGCCSSSPRTCVSPGSKSQGTTCIANCECAAGLTCRGSPQTCQP